MSKFPTGSAFLLKVRELEENCAKETWSTLSKTGRRVPATLEAIGDILSLLSQACGCAWGCAGKDHTINHIGGRVASAASASLRCIEGGYYDESLMLSRSIGEVANLLCLFVRERSELPNWKSATAQIRRRTYLPVQVRKKLEGMGVEPPISHERYAALSGIGIHVSPDSVPQGHNPRRRAVLGQIFQLPGAILALTELAIATSVAAHQTSRLLVLPEDVLKTFDERTRVLIEAFPEINILNVRNILASLKHSSNQGQDDVDNSKK